jgi:hypothetical protein
VFAAEPFGQTLSTARSAGSCSPNLLQSDWLFVVAAPPSRTHTGQNGVGLPLGPLFLNAVLDGRRGVDEQPIESAVKFVHGSIASRANSI